MGLHTSLGCLSSKSDVRNHIIKCNASIKKDTSKLQNKKNDKIHYTFDSIHKVFSRLKKV